MASTEIKTKETNASVEDFVNKIQDDQQREDSKAILKMMEKVTGDKPKMWGASLIGFGNVHLKYASGRELDWCKIGFAPRKQNMTLYVLGNSNEHPKQLEKLGKHTTGVGCLYIKKLADVDTDVLEEIIEIAVKNSDTNRRSY